MTIRPVTERYEERLWEELNLLLADAVPDGASREAAERAVLLAVTGHDAEIADLYWQVRRLARTEWGFLRERLEEDNPVSAVGRQLAGERA
ncbi:MAG TPA: hypothetical protein VFK14_08130 [Solirubrobacterales bacterium]|nr:hypothetical protein [Solirubrobacterales bacterium]